MICCVNRLNKLSASGFVPRSANWSSDLMYFNLINLFAVYYRIQYNDFSTCLIRDVFIPLDANWMAALLSSKIVIGNASLILLSASMYLSRTPFSTDSANSL
jgi:hypothetical protein